METKQRTAEEVILSLKKTLLKITNWDMPSTGKFWDAEKTRPTSYGTEYGSNGERDHIKSVARKALEETEFYSIQSGNGQEIEFAEWITEEQYVYGQNKHSFGWKHVADDWKGKLISTSELFLLFKVPTPTTSMVEAKPENNGFDINALIKWIKSDKCKIEVPDILSQIEVIKLSSKVEAKPSQPEGKKNCNYCNGTKSKHEKDCPDYQE